MDNPIIEGLTAAYHNQAVEAQTGLYQAQTRLHNAEAQTAELAMQQQQLMASLAQRQATAAQMAKQGKLATVADIQADGTPVKQPSLVDAYEQRLRSFQDLGLPVPAKDLENLTHIRAQEAATLVAQRQQLKEQSETKLSEAKLQKEGADHLSTVAGAARAVGAEHYPLYLLSLQGRKDPAAAHLPPQYNEAALTALQQEGMKVSEQYAAQHAQMTAETQKKSEQMKEPLWKAQTAEASNRAWEAAEIARAKKRATDLDIKNGGTGTKEMTENQKAVNELAWQSKLMADVKLHPIAPAVPEERMLGKSYQTADGRHFLWTTNPATKAPGAMPLPHLDFAKPAADKATPTEGK